MADITLVKISALPAAEQIGAEDLLPVVQEGATKAVAYGVIKDDIANELAPDATLSEAGKAADAKAVGDALALKADKAELTAEVNRIDAALNTKVNNSTYTAEVERIDGDIATKADAAATTAALATKANANDVTEALALKADTATVSAQLATKADTSAVNSALALKADKTELNTAVSELDDDINNLNSQTAVIKNAIGETMVLATELHYFSGTDLSEDLNNGSRGRTGIFNLYAPVLLQFSKPDYQFRIYKQTFTDGVQTTTDIIGYWAAAKPYYISDVDFDANYRIMIRKIDSSSMRDEDFSELYFTALTDFQCVTPYIKEEIAIVSALSAAKNDNTIVIALNTDNHYNDSDGKDYKQAAMAKNIASMAAKVGADFVANLGDIIEGYNDNLTPETYHFPYVNQARLSDIVNALATATLPLIYSIGHHEMYPIADIFNGDVRTENRGFTMAEVRRAVFGINEASYTKGFRLGLNDTCVDDDPSNGQSFYFDYTKGAGTIRFIVVDGCDYTNRGYSPETITFVTNALTDAKQNDLPVIMMCHIPPISAGVISGTSTKSRNEDEYNAAIDGVGANIIAYFYGHVHHDNIIPAGVLKPYPLIGFDCMRLYRQWSTPPAPMYGTPTCPARNINTYTEYAFDFVTIDTVTHEINCYRFGAGDTGTYPTRTI